MSTERRFFLAGVQFRPNAKEVISQLEEGEVLELEPEPENKFDANAIKINYYDGREYHHLGYVPKLISAEISALLEVEELECVVTTLNKEAKPWQMCEVTVKPVVPEEFEDLDEEEDYELDGADESYVEED
jgi:hypothetical protein